MQQDESSSITIKSQRLFADSLWRSALPQQYIEFNFIRERLNPDSGRTVKQLQSWYATKTDFFANFDKHIQYFHFMNRKLWNIHHGVNPRIGTRRTRGRNEDVPGYAALWIDSDDHEHPRENTLAFLEDMKSRGTPASAIIESGHGLHAYWFLREIGSVDVIRPLLAGLQDASKTDPINDPVRVLRFPGFSNVKDPKAIVDCRLIDRESFQTYEPKDFEDFRLDNPGRTAEEEEDQERTEKIRKTLKGAERNPKLRDIASGVPEGQRNQACATFCGVLFAKGKSAEEVLEAALVWAANCTPPLPEDEVRATVKSISKAEERHHPKGRSAAAHDSTRQHTKADSETDLEPWWDDKGRFVPALMAHHLAKTHSIISSPINTDGRGIQIYVYKDGVYDPNGIAFVTGEIARLLADRTKTSRVNEVVDILKIITKIQYDELNPRACELINCSNGMLDWRTGDVLPHDPKYISTIRIPLKWNPEATSPELDSFLASVLPQDSIPLVEEFAGYLLIPDTSMQQACVLVGPGGTGKGTFLKLQSALLGHDNISAVPIHAIEEDKFSVAALLGKLANIFHDLDSSFLASTGTTKSIISGDPISGEFKFESRFTFTPRARLLYSANDFPRASDSSSAWIGRWIFIHFPNSFRDSPNRITEYHKVLIQTPGLMEALLARSVAGLRRLKSSGKFTPSKSSAELLENYRTENNSVLEFVQDSCDVHPENGRISRKELFGHYKFWASENGIKPVSSQNFCKHVRQIKGIRDLKTSGERCWTGMAWKHGVIPMCDPGGDQSPPSTTPNENFDF